jgi:hypothetical protein
MLDSKAKLFNKNNFFDNWLELANLKTLLDDVEVTTAVEGIPASVRMKRDD